VSVIRVCLAAASCVFAVAIPRLSQAQMAATTQASALPSSYETRSELERRAVEAEKAKRTEEAWLLRYRLKNGDFQEGDRVLFVLDGTGAMSDTLIVKSSKKLEIPRLAEVSLDGVLRSELADSLKEHLSKYIKDPKFHVTPLLPLVIIGAVSVPGYYYTAADVVLRDVVNRARITGQADLNRVTIRRDGRVIWKPADVRTALNDGLSIDRLHLRAGDELSVAGRKKWSAMSVLPWITGSASLLVIYEQVSRGGRRR